MKILFEEGSIRHWGISEADEAYVKRENTVCPMEYLSELAKQKQATAGQLAMHEYYIANPISYRFMGCAPSRA